MISGARTTVAAVDLADALVAEADAEHGHARAAEVPRSPRTRRRRPRGGPGPARSSTRVRPSARRPVEVDLVVAHHDRLGAELAEVLDEVVDEAVVVVDDDDPRRHAPRAYLAVSVPRPDAAPAGHYPRGPWLSERAHRQRQAVTGGRAERAPPDGSPRRGRKAPGSRTSGRYTAPIPREVRRSPRWYPWMLLGLLLGGVILRIILNYIDAPARRARPTGTPSAASSRSSPRRCSPPATASRSPGPAA